MPSLQACFVPTYVRLCGNSLMLNGDVRARTYEIREESLESNTARPQADRQHSLNAM